VEGLNYISLQTWCENAIWIQKHDLYLVQLVLFIWVIPVVYFVGLLA